MINACKLQVLPVDPAHNEALPSTFLINKVRRRWDRKCIDDEARLPSFNGEHKSYITSLIDLCAPRCSRISPKVV